jgi:hypothetical protein
LKRNAEGAWKSFGRVEEWRGGVGGWALRVTGPLIDQLHKDFKDEQARMKQHIMKVVEPLKSDIGSLDQTIKRLERQLEILQKEIGDLKKDALTEADIKPFKKLLK